MITEIPSETSVNEVERAIVRGGGSRSSTVTIDARVARWMYDVAIQAGGSLDEIERLKDERDEARSERDEANAETERLERRLADIREAIGSV